MQGIQVQSLVGELRSYMLHGMAKKKKEYHGRADWKREEKAEFL